MAASLQHHNNAVVVLQKGMECFIKILWSWDCFVANASRNDKGFLGVL